MVEHSPYHSKIEGLIPSTADDGWSILVILEAGDLCYNKKPCDKARNSCTMVEHRFHHYKAEGSSPGTADANWRERTTKNI